MASLHCAICRRRASLFVYFDSRKRDLYLSQFLRMHVRFPLRRRRAKKSYRVNRPWDWHGIIVDSKRVVWKCEWPPSFKCIAKMSQSHLYFKNVNITEIMIKNRTQVLFWKALLISLIKPKFQVSFQLVVGKHALRLVPLSICGTNANYISTDDGDIRRHTVSNGGQHVPSTKQDRGPPGFIRKSGKLLFFHGNCVKKNSHVDTLATEHLHVYYCHDSHPHFLILKK